MRRDSRSWACFARPYLGATLSEVLGGRSYGLVFGFDLWGGS
jgi:hypothetical protein